MQAFQRWFAWYMSDGAKAIRDDEQNFMDSSTVKLMVVEERVVVPRNDGAP